MSIATARAAIRGPVTHILRVNDYDVESGTITFDEGWSPRIQASITAAGEMPVPQNGETVTVEAGYRYLDGTEELFISTVLVARDIVTACNQYPLRSVSADSAELVNSGALSTTAWNISQPAGILEACQAYANRIALEGGPNITFTGVSPGTRPDLVWAGLKVEPGDDLWQRIEDLVHAAGRWLVPDDSDPYHWIIGLRPDLDDVANSVETLTGGVDGTLIDGELQYSLDEWYNHVLVIHEWEDSAGTPQRVIGSSGRPDTVRRTLTLRRRGPATQDSADSEAAAALHRTTAHPASVSIEAISSYWLRPGSRVDIPTITGGAGLVSSVQYRFPAGTMSAHLRLA